MYQLDHHEICRVGRPMAVYDRYEISFLSIKGRCHGNQFLLALSTELFQWDSVDGVSVQ